MQTLGISLIIMSVLGMIIVLLSQQVTIRKQKRCIKRLTRLKEKSEILCKSIHANNKRLVSDMNNESRLAQQVEVLAKKLNDENKELTERVDYKDNIINSFEEEHVKNLKKITSLTDQLSIAENNYRLAFEESQRYKRFLNEEDDNSDEELATLIQEAPNVI